MINVGREFGTQSATRKHAGNMTWSTLSQYPKSRLMKEAWGSLLDIPMQSQKPLSVSPSLIGIDICTIKN